MSRPIYIEKCGFIKPSEVFKVCEEDYLWKSFYQDYELTSKHLFMSCSVASNQQVFNSFTILDLANFSVGMLSGQVKKMV